MQTRRLITVDRYTAHHALQRRGLRLVLLRRSAAWASSSNAPGLALRHPDPDRGSG
jgi:hypothetical protein